MPRDFQLWHDAGGRELTSTCVSWIVNLRKDLRQNGWILVGQVIGHSANG